MNEDYEERCLLAPKVKELLVAIVSYYKTHPRSVNSNTGVCQYLLPLTASFPGCGDLKETRCAVGQFLKESVLEQIGCEEMSLKEAVEVCTDEVFTGSDLSLNALFVPGAQGMPYEFWELAQELHDDSKNWVTAGCGVELSKVGWIQLNKIASRYGVCGLITQADLITLQ